MMSTECGGGNLLKSQPPPSDTPGTPRGGSAGRPRGQAREILALAVPALGALIAEPLMLLADSAIVGRLGTVPLAGLAIAATLLGTLVYVFVFLAYATTATVARLIGAGRPRDALAQGLDGMWLSLLLGLIVIAVAYPAAPALIGAFGPSPQVAEQAITYLHASLLGIPAMFVVLATNGVLRGLQDTRTPLWIAVGGASANAVAALVLVHGFGPVPGLGIVGAGAATAGAQIGMALAGAYVVARAARRQQVSLLPHGTGVLAAARGGLPLLLRTIALRGALAISTWVVAGKGDVALAAHQVTSNLWTLLALTLDAIAIAAQAITGRHLGAGDIAATRSATALMVRWGLWVGAGLGAILLLVRGWLGPLFVADPHVWTAMSAALLVAALGQPLAGYVFVLDGVLIGAGDGAFLAWAGVAQVLAYLPMAIAVAVWAPSGAVGLVWAWVAWNAFMALRGLSLGLRIRSSAWTVTGA